MEKILAIIQREYLQRVRTRAFVISTIATPIIMLGLTVLPILLASRGGGARHVAVLDQSGDPQLYQALQKRLGGLKSGYQVTSEDVVVAPDQDIDEIRKSRSPQLEKETDSALVLLRPDILNGGQAEYDSNNVSDPSIEEIARSVSGAVVERRLTKAGLDSAKIDQFTIPVEMKRVRLNAGGATEDSGQNFIVAFVLLFAIYITVLLYGVMIMRSVIEEKQSRVVEVVISSVRPFQMMMGKLIGVGLVALTQVAIWAVSVAIITTAGAQVVGGGHLPHIAPSLYVYFVVYFVLGYFLFATLYAMVGSTVSAEDEAQQLQFPITLLLVVPIMLFGMILRDPNGPTAVGLSLVPFFTPTLMILRIAIASPPLWQPLLSIAIMLLAIVAAVWVAGRIYRVCILMYGKRPSIAELGRWIRYS